MTEKLKHQQREYEAQQQYKAHVQVCLFSWYVIQKRELLQGCKELYIFIKYYSSKNSISLLKFIYS